MWVLKSHEHVWKSFDESVSVDLKKVVKNFEESQKNLKKPWKSLILAWNTLEESERVYKVLMSHKISLTF